MQSASKPSLRHVEVLAMSKMLFVLIAVSITARCPRMDVSIAQGATRTFLALLLLSSSILQCHHGQGRGGTEKTVW